MFLLFQHSWHATDWFPVQILIPNICPFLQFDQDILCPCCRVAALQQEVARASFSGKMPIMCDNSMLLNHMNKDKIDALEKVLINAGNPGVSHHLRPRPVEQDNNRYNWNDTNWGTKWDIGIAEFRREDDLTILIKFLTPLNLPIALYEILV